MILVVSPSYCQFYQFCGTELYTYCFHFIWKQKIQYGQCIVFSEFASCYILQMCISICRAVMPGMGFSSIIVKVQQHRLFAILRPTSDTLRYWHLSPFFLHCRRLFIKTILRFQKTSSIFDKLGNVPLRILNMIFNTQEIVPSQRSSKIDLVCNIP